MATGQDRKRRPKGLLEIWGVAPGSFEPKQRMVLPSYMRQVLDEAGVDSLVAIGAPLVPAVLFCPPSNQLLLVRFVRLWVPEARGYEGRRFMLAYRQTVRWDEKGRFYLEQGLARHAELQSTSLVLFIATGRWIELWKSALYRERKEQWEEAVQQTTTNGRPGSSPKNPDLFRSQVQTAAAIKDSGARFRVTCKGGESHGEESDRGAG